MRPLRLATLNVASGRGPRGAMLSPDALAEAVRALRGYDLDVLAVQEVDAAQERSAGVHQAALLAEVLGMEHWRFAPTLRGTPGPGRTWVGVAGQLEDAADGPRYAGPRYGVALLSRRPVRAWHALGLAAGPARLPLRAPDPRTGLARWWTFPDEPRVALAAVLEAGNGEGSGGTGTGTGSDGTGSDGGGETLTIACTHLSFAPPTARRQLQAVRDWLTSPALGSPVGLRLLAGDLNLPRALLPRDVTSPVQAATFPGSRPRLQLDHVLALAGPPVHLRGAAHLLACGDHRALVVEVTAAEGSRPGQRSGRGQPAEGL